jgi:hypothetical protein
MFDPDELAEGRKLIPDNLKNNYHRGIISKNAKKKITKAIDYLVYISPKKHNRHPYYNRSSIFILNFITLTLSSKQIHTDNEIKSNILEPFLNSCRKKWQISYYVWRAEKQKNGSIHFHLITNRFVPWNELRNCWNTHQQKLGYIDRYREHQQTWHRSGFRYRSELSSKWNYASQLKAYKDGLLHDWHNPNSTDVHSLRFVSNVKTYFIKYLTKSEQSGNIEGRLWGCSYNLSNLKGARTCAEGLISDELNKLTSLPDSKIYKSDYFSVIYFNPDNFKPELFPLLSALFDNYLSDRFPEYHPRFMAA